MKRVPPLPLLILMLGISSPLWASLGDTPEQMEARHGKPASVTTPHPEAGYSAVYTTDKFKIIAVFFHGVVHREVYMKWERAAITPEDVTELLKANARGKEWKDSVGEEPNFRFWSTGDAEARFPNSKDGFAVQTNEFAKFQKEWFARPIK